MSKKSQQAQEEYVSTLENHIEEMRLHNTAVIEMLKATVEYNDSLRAVVKEDAIGIAVSAVVDTLTGFVGDPLGGWRWLFGKGKRR